MVCRPHAAFLLIDLELEFPFKKTLNAVLYPLSSALAFNQDHKVVRIADKPVSSLLKLLIQIIQKYICQKLWEESTETRQKNFDGSMSSRPKNCARIPGQIRCEDIMFWSQGCKKR